MILALAKVRPQAAPRRPSDIPTPCYPRRTCPPRPNSPPPPTAWPQSLAWGTSDFLGGYATRRANAFLFTVVVNLGGLLVVGTLAAGTHARSPPHAAQPGSWPGASPEAQPWPSSIAHSLRENGTDRAGRRRAQGRDPGSFLHVHRRPAGQDSPSRLRHRRRRTLAHHAHRRWSKPEGIGLAVVAGIGFASFYLCVRQAGDASALWIATLTRTGGLIVTSVIVLVLRNFRDITSSRRALGRHHRLHRLPRHHTRSSTPARADASTKRSSSRRSIPPSPCFWRACS